MVVRNDRWRDRGTNAAGEFFGGARVAAMLEEAPELQWPGETVNRIRSRVHAFASGTEPADDMTLLVVRWNGPQKAGA